MFYLSNNPNFLHLFSLLSFINSFNQYEQLELHRLSFTILLLMQFSIYYYQLTSFIQGLSGNYKQIYFSFDLTSMTFRSLQMSQYQMIIPRDSAYLTLNMLGHENAIHLTDSADPSNRSFSQVLKRCDQSLQKIQFIGEALKKESLQFQQYDQSEPLFVENLKKNWKEEAKILGIEETKLIDVYEQKVSNEYKIFHELVNKIQKMILNQKQSLQKIACFEILNEYIGENRPKRQTQEYYLNNISDASKIQSVSFLVGVVDFEMEWKISKMIYRVSRGYACTKTLSQFKFPGLKNLNKKVILVIYPSSQNQTLEKRLTRLFQTFCDNYFLQHEFELSAKTNYNTAVKQYTQVSSLIQLAEKQYKTFLNQVRKLKNMQTWRVFFWKERGLYQNMNKLDRREQFFIANIYIPRKEINRVSLLINRIIPTPTLHQVPLQFPPTAFDTNSYTNIAQEITDTYGVPRYREINPSIFTTVTFPFFFGVMFGDVAHGIMVLALGLYAVFNNDNLQKGALKILSQLRYMITLMGFFAIYCGFIYNDLAGFNMNFFGSCFHPPPHPHGGPDEITQQVAMKADPGCIYPFGLDPIWGRSQNQLVYVNSLKMKISVIIAIIHMTFGVLCKASNTLYFKKKIDFYFEFIPQFIFLFGVFGFMDFLIIFKWLKLWDQRVDNISPQQWAPSIIATMMNIFLGFGQTSTKPDGASNMWGERGNSSQDIIQLIILLVAIICIPTMLLPKPYIEAKKLKMKKQNIKHNPLVEEQNLMNQSKNALEQKLNPKQIEPADSHHSEQTGSEIFVHQLIETIQFVLGTISNTASYLRLWALSLAHSQLSKVFFQQTAGRFFGDKMFFEVPSLFIGSYMVMWITFGIILCMDSMECFLHSLRLHWVQFQNKFYKGDGYRYTPLSYHAIILEKKKK